MNLAVANGQQQQRPKSKQEEIMEREKAAKRQRAEHDAAVKAAEAKKNARPDAPWLQEGIVVKVRICGLQS